MFGCVKMELSELGDFKFEFDKFYQLVLLYINIVKKFPHYYSDQDRALYEKHCAGFVDELHDLYLIPDIIADAGNEIQTNLKKTICT